MSVTLTNEQQQVFDAALDGEDLIVVAHPGVGKTFFVNHLAEYMATQQDKFVWLTTFNRDAESQFTKGKNRLVITTTSLGYNIANNYWYWTLRKPQVKSGAKLTDNNPKYVILIRQVMKMMGFDKKEVAFALRTGIYELLQFCQMYLAETNEEIERAWYFKYGVAEMPPYFPQVVKQALQYGKEVKDFSLIKSKEISGASYAWNRNVTYTDCIWLPNQYNMSKHFTGWKKWGEYDSVPKPDVIFVDEAQDLNFAQRSMLRQIRDKYDAQMIVVGDDQQAMYSFAGADSYSTQGFKEEFDLKEMSISQTFRCPSIHCQYMNTWDIVFPDSAVRQPRKLNAEINAFDKTKPGILETISFDEIAERVVPGKTVLTGRNFNGTQSDIIAALAAMINRGYSIRLEGYDLLKIAKPILDEMKESNLSKVEVYVAVTNLIRKMEYRMQEDEKFYIDLEEYTKNLQLSALIVDLCNDCVTAEEVEQFIIEKMNCENPDVVFSTVHRVKGSTWPVVFVLNYDTMPRFRDGQTPEMWDEEVHILHVAVSRSNHALYLVKTPTE